MGDAPRMGGSTYPTQRPDRGRGFKVGEGGMVEVFDLDLASYLSMRGVPLSDARKHEREFVFKFLDPDGTIAQIAIEYVNSESAKFADAQRRLKKVIHSQPGRW